MANRHPLHSLGRILALALLACLTVHPAMARLPWAAKSGVHFVDAVVAADNYRAKAGGLAMKKSPSYDVREFGRALWLNSLDNRRRITWVLTKNEPYVVLPERVTPQYGFVIDRLVPVRNEAFDREFIAQQIASLEESLALAADYSRAGDDLDLKEYAARSVPRLQSQLDRIREIAIRHERLALR